GFSEIISRRHFDTLKEESRSESCSAAFRMRRTPGPSCKILSTSFRLPLNRIAMDDFDTGYSSFSYLGGYPFDVIKIDSSFIRDLTLDSGDKALIKASIAMAHGMNLKRGRGRRDRSPAPNGLI
ncbi:MAG: EAL domain-containing protein, partial [Nitrospiria bacterium]